MSAPGTTKIKGAVRRLINEAVATGSIEPHEALAILMTVAAGYVAQVRDDGDRTTYVSHVTEHFGPIVEFLRTGDERTIAMAEAIGGTRQ
jgi:hypothetical protein